MIEMELRIIKKAILIDDKLKQSRAEMACSQQPTKNKVVR